MLLQEYPPRVRSTLEELGIPTELISARALPVHPEARELVVAEYGENGREHLLVPAAAAAWRHITAAARSDNVNLQIASAFRSFERQAEIVREKLEGGLSIDAILLVSAPPGFSEHHTGRAVDVTTLDCLPLEGAFAHTEAFQWLWLHAKQFGFALSYPEGNLLGYAYEPWHWCFRETEV